MSYSAFSGSVVDHMNQPMFLGENVTVARYDQNRFPIFNDLTELQQGFFWRASEVDTMKDISDFKSLPDNERFVFLSNLSYQTMMDSLQGRAPSITLLPLVSLPELETWIDTWTFSETIHSRSYTHIIQTVLSEAGVVLDDIPKNKAILARAGSITKYYDDLYRMGSLYNLFGFGKYRVEGEEVVVNEVTLRESIYRCLIAINALEAVRFYVSFACSFSFAQRSSRPVMEGVASIMKLIAKDESLHRSGTESMINIFQTQEGDICQDVAHRLRGEAVNIFMEVVNQEKEWAKYLFQHGSMIGLNEKILSQYIDYLAVDAMTSIGLTAPIEGPHLDAPPIKWMAGWLGQEDVQKAPQETTETDYISGGVETSYDAGEFAKIFQF